MSVPLADIVQDLEQLELAAEQLDRRNPAAARVALILTDNVMEGIGIRVIKRRFACDAYLNAVGFKYPPTKRRKIMRGFPSMMDFLASADVRLLSREDAEISKRCHAFRNDCYHHVRTHSDVIDAIARKYFDHTCAIYGKSHGAFFCELGRREPFFEKHGFTDPADYGEGIQEILRRLAAERTCTQSELAQALALSLRPRIKHTIDTTNRLAACYGLTRAETFRRIQFYGIDRTGREVEPDDGTAAWFERRISEWSAELTPYRAFIDYSMLRRWRKAALALRKEQDAATLLIKFKEIDGITRSKRERLNKRATKGCGPKRRDTPSFTEVEEVVADAALAWDNWVNNEVQRMRGD